MGEKLGGWDDGQIGGFRQSWGRKLAGWRFLLKENLIHPDWQTPRSKMTSTVFHEDIKEMIENQPSLRNGSQPTNVLCPTSLPLRYKQVTQRQSNFVPEAKRACTDRPQEHIFLMPAMLPAPCLVVLKSSASSFLGHKEIIKYSWILFWTCRSLVTFQNHKILE